MERVYVAIVELTGREAAISVSATHAAVFEWLNEYFPSEEYTEHIIALAHEYGREMFRRDYMIEAAPDYHVADDAFDEAEPWTDVESVTLAIVPLAV